MDRSGATVASMVSSGWTRRINRVIAGDNRRTIGWWEKTAGASESDDVVTDLDGQTHRTIIDEYSTDTGEFSFVEIVEANNGETDDATAIGSGSTSSLGVSDYALIGGGAVKLKGGTPAFVYSWASEDLTTGQSAVGAGFGRSCGSGYLLLESTSGAKSTTMSIGGASTANEGLWTGLGVFEITAGGVDNLTATGITTGAPSVGTPNIGQVHALSGTGITTGAPILGAPTIGQIHALTATGIATGAPTIGTPAIAQVHALTGQGIATGAPTLEPPSIGQVHALVATGISAGAPTLGTPTLAEGVDDLVALGIATGAPTIGSPTLGQVHALSALGIAAGAPVLGNPAIDAVLAEGLARIEFATAIPGVGISAAFPGVAISATRPRIDITTE
jgi:hypothetical protein